MIRHHVHFDRSPDTEEAIGAAYYVGMRNNLSRVSYKAQLLPTSPTLLASHRRIITDLSMQTAFAMAVEITFVKPFVVAQQ